MTFTIREASKEDTPVILDLIKDLALYEKDPEAVKTTHEDILHYGFGENRMFQCLIVEKENIPVAFALYFFTWSTWEGKPSLYLEDLFVKPEFRKNKIGIKLLNKLAIIAKERNCRRMDWAVLDWNKPAIDFYKKIGAEIKEDWQICRLNESSIANIASLDC